MHSIPNLISLTRAPLALLFLQDNSFLRIAAILMAMISDGLDGFLARHFRTSNKLGVLLDPLMDKFFVYFALAILIHEERLSSWQLSAIISRDFAIAIFGLYLGLSGGWARYHLRAFWCGKVVTTLQFFVLIVLTCGMQVPHNIYWTFVLLGTLALVELYFIQNRKAIVK